MTTENATQPSAPASPARSAAQPSAQDQIDSVMNLPADKRATHPYWNERDPRHKDAVEAMYTLRQSQAATDEQAAARVDGFGPGPVQSPDYAAVEFPSALPQEVHAPTAQAAQDFGMGATELGSVLKAAEPYLSDNKRYSFQEGEAALKRELGDKYEATLKAARDYVQQFGPAFQGWLGVRGMLNHPGAVKAFAARMQARASVQAELDAIRKDPAFLGGRDHVRSKQLAEQALELTRRLSE